MERQNGVVMRQNGVVVGQNDVVEGQTGVVVGQTSEVETRLDIANDRCNLSCVNRGEHDATTSGSYWVSVSDLDIQ